MYTPRTKRQELLRRLVTYTVMPVIVTIGVVVLLMYVVGYRYDSETNEFEQGGLMQLMSRPTGAHVTVDDSPLFWRTNTRFDAVSGNHTVTMAREGYRPWQKTVTVNPGEVLWVDYALLVPEVVETQTVAKFGRIDQTVAVMDRDMIVFIKDMTDPIIHRVDTSGGKSRVIATPIPDNLYTTKKNTKETPVFTIDSVDKSGRYAVIRANSADFDQWLLVDLERPEKSKNLSRLIDDPISRAMISIKNPRRIYVVAKAALREVNLDDMAVSLPLVSSILSVDQSGGGVFAYTARADSNTKRVIGYYTPGAKKPYVLRTLYDAADVTDFHIGQFLGTTYGVLQRGKTIELTRFSLVKSDEDENTKTDTVASISLQQTPQVVSFSPDQRFIMMQHNTTLKTYDLELGTLATITLQGNDSKNYRLGWLDDHHFWSDRDDTVTVYEFDGSNAQEIVSSTPGYDVLLSDNNHYLYSFIETSAGVSLRKSLLRVD